MALVKVMIKKLLTASYSDIILTHDMFLLCKYDLQIVLSRIL